LAWSLAASLISRGCLKIVTDRRESVMNENLESTLSVLRNYIAAHGLSRHVSLSLQGGHIRITLLAESRDLWLGRRYYIVPDPRAEPEMFFELNESVLSELLQLPSGPQPASESGHHFLFVSYSRADEDLVLPIVDLLRLTDTKVFRDKDSIRAGDRWRPSIDQAIDECTDCLVFWCQHASSSGELAREVERAVRLNKKVVPVLLDDCPLDDVLRDFQAIDMRFFEPHSWAASGSAPGRETGAPESSTSTERSTPQAAAAYLSQQLGDLLGIRPQPLLGQEAPNTPSDEPTSTSPEES
jgi:hypothetical protein